MGRPETGGNYWHQPAFDAENQETDNIYQRLEDSEAEKLINERLGQEKLQETADVYHLLEREAGLLPESFEKTETMVADLARLLLELEKDLVSYDTIISDDSSGRLPSLLLRKLIDGKRKAAGLPLVKTFFIASGRHDFELLKDKLAEFIKQHQQDSSKFLLVTEHIGSGKSIEAVVKLFEELNLDFDLAAISLADRRQMLKGAAKSYPNHLRYGGLNDSGYYFYGHLGSGVVKDTFAHNSTVSIHPLKIINHQKPDALESQELINKARKNINFLAEQLQPLVESK